MDKLANGMFYSQKAGSFPFEGTVVEIDSTEPVNAAFHVLVENQILSAPVYDASRKKYLGFFDIVDALALAYSIDMLVTALPSGTLRKPASGETSDTAIGEIFGPDGEMTNSCSSWNPVFQDEEMSKVMELLARGVRRVPVIGADNKVIKIISQSAVVNALKSALDADIKDGTLDPKLKELLEQTPEKDNIGIRDVLTVESGAPARDAFTQIMENNVSAIGVLEEEDQSLFSCISTRDIKLFPTLDDSAKRMVEGKSGSESKRADSLLSLKNHSLLDMSCIDFIAAIRQTSHAKNARPALVSAHSKSSLMEIISKLGRTKLHRIFIVDADQKPVGIMSVSDIVKMIA